MKASRTIAAGLLAAVCVGASAQTVPPPQNVLQLSTNGTVEVQQDLLAVQMSTSRDGADAATVQIQLRNALEAALAEAKKTAQPGQLEVRTGQFALYPRQGRDNRISGWTGSAELILEGRDFARITQAAARVQTMTISGVHFGLSREQRAKVEGEAQLQAIEKFKARAAELAKAFGFSGYTLREVSVNANDAGPMPRHRMMAMEASAPAAAPVPVEPGKSTVVVTVSGSVQLR